MAPPVHTALTLSERLIAEQSVTPDQSGALALVKEALVPLGFACTDVPFGDTPNLWAVRGDGSAPIVAFIGHTDVVPAGNLDGWRTPPFTPTVIDGVLYGRGAADMKSAIAAFICAVEQFVAATPRPAFRLALLLTGDEEGTSVNGTPKVVRWLGERHVVVDYAIVGEPSATAHTGDVIKIGRRGSLSFALRINGVQGHVAYPAQVDNPNHRLARILAALADIRWDNGNAHFPPTSLQITDISGGVGADNVVPAVATAIGNVRFSPALTVATIKRRISGIVAAHASDYSLDWRLSGEPFYTGADHPLVHCAIDAITAVTGKAPLLATTGGTSDGRFLAPTGTAVVEVGVPNATIHKVNECVRLADIEVLCAIYTRLLATLDAHLR